MSNQAPPPAVRPELIRLGAIATDKQDAIRQAGQMLVAAGWVGPGYEGRLIRGAAVARPYLGSVVSLPNGMD